MKKRFLPFDTSGGRRAAALAPVAVVCCSLGCSGGPSAIKPPSINAGSAASAAMELYDGDGDGAIAGAELEAAASFKASMETLDANKDGQVQQDEIAQRIESWQATGTGLTSITCSVTLDGKPLPEATVTFEPEPFLADDLQTAVGETAPSGSTRPTIPKEQRVPADAPPGLQYGFYRVRISKTSGGKETLPARYNAETTLGQQVAGDDPAMLRQEVRFELKSK